VGIASAGGGVGARGGGLGESGMRKKECRLLGEMVLFRGWSPERLLLAVLDGGATYG